MRARPVSGALRRAVAFAVVAGTALWWAAPAAAVQPEPGLVMSNVQTEPGLVTFLLTPTNLDPESTVDLSSITARVGERVLPVQVRSTVAVTGAPTRALMVVLNGGEEFGTGFAMAQQAARAIPDALPADVALGLVSAGPQDVEILAPTLDRSAYRAAVDAALPANSWPPVDGVYDARETLAAMVPAVERRILVISDGVNASASDWDTRVGQGVADVGIGLDIVAIRASGTGLASLTLVAEAADGRIVTVTDATTATEAALRSPSLFARTLHVTVSVPVALSGRTEVLTVEAAGFHPTTATLAFAPWKGRKLPVKEAPLAWVPDWLVYVVAVLFFGAVVSGVLALAWPRSESHALIKKIAYFGPRRVKSSVDGTAPGPAPDSAAALSNSLVGRATRSVLSASETVLRAGKLQERIAARLERAGMKVRPHEWIALRAGIAVAAGLLMALVGGVAGFVFGAALGAAGTLVYQLNRISRRNKAFTEQLPEGLQLVIGSLRSGFSLAQALESLVRESPEPLASEFGRVVAEHRLGSDLSDALERLAQRVGSEDLSWAVMAVRIQREVGGNLADVLQTGVDTMRERERLRRHVRALSAEGRLSAWVLMAVPVILTVVMLTFRRSYLSPLFTDPRGVAMLVVAVGLFAAGAFWLSRLVKVEP